MFMKKLTALLMGIILMAILSVTASAGVRIITPDAGYEAYPILYNKNVTFYSIGDDESLTEIEFPAIADMTDGIYGPGDAVQVTFAKNPENHHLPAFKLVEGSDDIYSQGVNVLGNTVIEIKFTGTAIKIGTCYRNGGSGSSKTVRVTVDGNEMPTIKDALQPPIPDDAKDDPTGKVHNTDPTYFFAVDGLKDVTHTIRIYDLEQGVRLALDHYEIIPGTGADEKSPTTFDISLTVMILAAATTAGIVVTRKRR